MRAYATLATSQRARLARASRGCASPAATILRLQRTAGNHAVLGIMRQLGPPIMYSPEVRKLLDIQKNQPQDLVKTDPMNPGSGVAADKLRDTRVEFLRKHGPQPRSGDAPLLQEADPKWRAFREGFSAGLPRRMVEHYATGGGKELTLSKADVKATAPIINIAYTFSRGGATDRITNHIGLHREIAALKAAGGGTKHIAFQGTGSAATHGTLGSFTILYDGELTVAKPGEKLDELGSSWLFTGTAVFYDVYNFEERSDRHPAAESVTWLGRNLMSGDAYQVVSEPVTVAQSEYMLNAVVEGYSADGKGGVPSRMDPLFKRVLPDPMKGSGSSGGW